jgi:hypothetical protein
VIVVNSSALLGEVSTLAGSEKGFADGNGHASQFHGPWGICFDEHSQSLLVCDSGNHKIRRVKLNGVNYIIFLILLWFFCAFFFSCNFWKKFGFNFFC